MALGVVKLEHRAVGGGDAVGRLDLEEVFGAGAQAAEQRRSQRCSRARWPWAG